MKKFLTCLILCLPFSFAFTACKKSVDYFSYVSEYRKRVYYYEDDAVSLKIYSVDKETPYALDGVKGNVGNVTEIYFEYDKNASEVNVELSGRGGEMSWLSVTRNYYLSFSGGEISGASVEVKLEIDGEEKKFTVQNVAEEGVIDGKAALNCVREYDAESFDKLTERGVFSGEITVRLLYDNGCYYYVGICDRDKNVHAYLVSGEDGRVIAERESQAEK